MPGATSGHPRPSLAFKEKTLTNSQVIYRAKSSPSFPSSCMLPNYYFLLLIIVKVTNELFYSHTPSTSVMGKDRSGQKFHVFFFIYHCIHSETVRRHPPEHISSSSWRLVLKCKTKKQPRNQNSHKMSSVVQVTSSPEAPNWYGMLFTLPIAAQPKKRPDWRDYLVFFFHLFLFYILKQVPM